MKKIILLLSFVCAALLSSEAFAFKSFGDVNEYLEYSNVQITSGSYPQVCAELENDSKKSVRIFADVIFRNRSGYLDKATVHAKLQPKSKNDFCAYLDGRESKAAREALFLDWDVYMLEVDGEQIYFRDSQY